MVLSVNRKVWLGGLVLAMVCVLIFILQIVSQKDMAALKLMKPDVELESSPASALSSAYPFLANLDSDTQVKHLNKAKKRAKDLQDSLISKYGTDNWEIFTVFDIPQQTKLFLMSRMLGKVAKGEKLVFAFTGTSVTAGHDVYYNESYPLVLGRTLAPVLKSLGVEFESRNLALGNNPIVPYNLCLKTLAGRDVDLISWEQGMMCPRNQAEAIEVFLRNSIALPSHPALLVLDAVPDDSGLSGVDYVKTQFFGDKASPHGLRQVYRKFPMHSLISVESIGKVKSDRDSFNKTRMMLSGKPFPKSGSWHPGKYGHEYVADLLAYSYAGLISDMTDLFSTMISESENLDDLVSKVELQSSFGEYELEDIPAPAWRSPESDYFLDAPGQSCATFFEPRTLETDFDLKNFIVSGDVVDIRDDVENYDQQSWGITLFKADVNGVKEMLEYQKGYKDLKWVIAGNNASGDLQFEFTTESNASPVILCEAPGPWGEYPDGYAMLKQNSSALVYVDQEQVELSENKEGWGPCYELEVELAPGVHRLTISPQSEKRLAISHLIWK